MVSSNQRLCFQDLRDADIRWYENCSSDFIPVPGDFVVGPRNDEGKKWWYQVLYREFLFVQDGSVNANQGKFDPVATFFVRKTNPPHVL